MKMDAVQISSTKSVETIGRELSQALNQIGAQNVDNLESNAGALAGYEDRAAIEILAEGKGLIGGVWAIQVYVTDLGDTRSIQLVALGDGGLTRAFHGGRNTTSLSGSQKKREQLREIMKF